MQRKKQVLEQEGELSVETTHLMQQLNESVEKYLKSYHEQGNQWEGERCIERRKSDEYDAKRGGEAKWER